MSSPELRESSARMLKVTGGCWPRNVPIPRAASGDAFTSRMVRKWRVFPYGRNIAVVVSAVMDKDRQGLPKNGRRLSGLLTPGQRGKSGGRRRLRPPAEGNRRWRRSQASLHLGRRQRQRRASEAPSRRRLCRRSAGWRRPRRRPERCRRQASVSPTSPPTFVWMTILVVSRWLSLFFFNFVGALQGRTRASLLQLRLTRRSRRLP
jgi:hypothetical protein